MLLQRKVQISRFDGEREAFTFFFFFFFEFFLTVFSFFFFFFFFFFKLSQQETSILKQLQHEHIVKYIDSFSDNGRFCIVTEFIAGETMRQHMQQYAGCIMPVGFVQMFTLDIVAALKYAHSKHVRHGDIKSDNVMLVLPNRDVKLLDFGVAELISAEAGATVDRSLVGTPNYMAPEFFDNSAVTYAADVWALGCLVCEMVSWRRALRRPASVRRPVPPVERAAPAAAAQRVARAARVPARLLRQGGRPSAPRASACCSSQFLREPAAWKSGQNLNDFGTKTQTFERDLEAKSIASARSTRRSAAPTSTGFAARRASTSAAARSSARWPRRRTCALPRSAAVAAAMAAARAVVGGAVARATDRRRRRRERRRRRASSCRAPATASSRRSPRRWPSPSTGTLIVVEPGEYDERLDARRRQSASP
jgi:hypothetical protein